MLNIGELFSDQPMFFIGFVFIIGLFVGSFLNVVIFRLPVMMEKEWLDNIREMLNDQLKNKKPTTLPILDQGCPQCHYQVMEKDLSQADVPKKIFNLAWPPSRCPHCQHKIRSYENIPVVSYLILKGCCRQCKTPISWRYPLIELMTALLSVLAAYILGPTTWCIGILIVTWALICLTLIDLDHYLLPDQITLPLMWLGIIWAYLEWGTVSLPQSILGAILGYLSLWSFYWIFKLVTKKEGMGYGDFKLLAALGAWLGVSALPSIVFISAIVGSIIGGLVLFVSQKGREHPIPYGPYLAIAGGVVFYTDVYLQQSLMSWFLRI